MNIKRVITFKEIRKKLPSLHLVGVEQSFIEGFGKTNGYFLCITAEISEQERKFLVQELKCYEEPFKDGLKTRFYLPEWAIVIG